MTITRAQLTRPDGLAVRAFEGSQIRAAETDDGARTITGIGVPYGEVYETPWFRERFEPGSIPDDSTARILFEHRTAIGKVIASGDTEQGREITAQLSRTATADEAYTLARDDVIRGFSIGFRPVRWREEHDDEHEMPLIVHEEVEVREYSLVTFPAYQDAEISGIRSTTPHAAQEAPAMTDTRADLVTRDEHDQLAQALTDSLEDVKRSMAALVPGPGTDTLAERAAEFDSIGEWVQAIASDRDARHDAALALYRDVTTSDVPSNLVNTPGFIGDLTKRVQERRRWTSRFKSRPLPAKGMTVDYIKTEITATVAEQTKQLDALAKGTGFKVTPASSPVRTFGGAETVSRQVIDRTEAWALTGMFEAFALQYARATEAATKTYITGLLNAILAAGTEGTTVSVPTAFGAFDWIDAIVDSAGIFEDRGYILQELAVSPDIFKKLAAEAGTDGRPLLTVSGQGVNTVGTVNLPAASGELMRVPVTVLHGSTGKALFYDPVAIETLESAGAPFMLQDDHVLNLSRDYACYGYLAHINPHPSALLPVKFTTA